MHERASMCAGAGMHKCVFEYVRRWLDACMYLHVMSMSEGGGSRADEGSIMNAPNKPMQHFPDQPQRR